MSDIGRQTANAYWSEMYAQLSEFFKEPSADFAEDVASGRLVRFFDEGLRLLGLDAATSQGLAVSGDARAQLDGEYRRLFLGPMPPYVVPVESVYKKWTNDPGCHLPMAEEKGLLLGDSAVDMMRRYHAEGIEIPEALSSMPDHAALLFEYMAHLSLGGDELSYREFLVKHMDWLDDLVRDIDAVVETEFYSCGARIARDVVNRARNTTFGISHD